MLILSPETAYITVWKIIKAERIAELIVAVSIEVLVKNRLISSEPEN